MIDYPEGNRRGATSPLIEQEGILKAGLRKGEQSSQGLPKSPELCKQLILIFPKGINFRTIK